MSSKNNKNKPTDPPVDHQTEMKMMSFTINLKEEEIKERNELINQLRNQLEVAHKDVMDIKGNYLQSFNNEKALKEMKKSLDQAQHETEKFKEDLKNTTKAYEQEREAMVKKYETELTSKNNMIETFKQKIQSTNNMQVMLDNQSEKIRLLEFEKDKIGIEADERIKNKEIKNEIKFSDLKKKMIENIQDTQKNVSQLNIEYMNVSTKLTLLQNHQLLVELEYQTQQIEELVKKKETLEKKVFELSRDIDVHKEVELSLAEKNKKLTEMVKSLESKTGDDLSSSINKSVLSSTPKDFSAVNNLEKKVLKLENSLKKKQQDYQNMKNNYESLELKLKNYEKKYAGIFNLFEEALKNLYNDEDFKETENIYVNIENIKRGDFSMLDAKEKYSVLLLLMKYLLPLISPKDLENSQIPMSNFDNVKFKYQISKKYLDDPMLKQVFNNKSTMLHSIRRSVEKLPQIQNNRKKNLSVQNSDLRVYNSRYQSVI